MNIEQARFNMVEQQIRTWGVLDAAVLDLLFTLRREDFVPPAYRHLAFVDMEIPLGVGAQPATVETMMTPKMEARIVQDMAVAPHERVLEIGTGSGYLTALLAKCAEQVVSIEIHSPFAVTATAKLATAGIHNVDVRVGDAAAGPGLLVGENRLFEVIVVTGSMPVLPESYFAHLPVGGRLFAVVGDAPIMTAALFTKTGAQTWRKQALFETVLPPLVHAVQPARFRF